MLTVQTNRWAALLLALAWLCLPAALEAAPVFGETFTEKQPDGTTVSYQAWGDEFYAFAESPDGYALTRQADGWICYATLSGGELVSTGIRLGGKGASQKAAASGLKPHLRLSSQAVADKIAASVDQLLGADLKALQAGKPSPLRAITTGNPRGIALLIDFSDDPATIPVADFNAFFNQTGYTNYGNNGSVRDYYETVSAGKLIYTNTVVTAYYRAKKLKSYYNDLTASYGSRARELVGEALSDLEARGFDFSAYDYDNNGYVDAINAFYAGNRPGVWAKGLWPHSGSGINLTFDGKKCNAYQISDISTSLSIGTTCHENGHMLLGFPDLYDYGSESSGTGAYCLMSSSGGKNPGQLCAYMKARAGWANLITLATPTANLPLTAGTLNIYKYPHPALKNEYYLIENRHKSAPHESGLPAQGLALWHIDENGSNDNDQMTAALHYKVTLVQADGRWELEHGVNSGGSADLFDATRKQAGPFTNPHTDWWNGAHSYLYLHDISASSSTMKFCFGDNDVLTMSQAMDLAATGVEGGPFTSATLACGLKNTAGTPLAWTARADVPWVAFSAPGGTLAAGEATTLTVSITDSAARMAPGVYTGIFTVTDTGTNVAMKRQARLRIYDKSLVARWRLDETAGTTAGDATDHGFDGTRQGAAAWTPSTVRGTGGGLALDGVNGNYVAVPPLNLYRNMATITAWVKRSGTQPKSAGIALWRGGATVAGLHFGNANELRYHWNDAKPTYNFDSGLIVPDGQWCFTALVIEPARATLYLHDGVELRAAVNNVANDLEEFNGAGGLGRDSYNTSRTLAGMLRDVRVYNYPLSAAELDAVRLCGGYAENPWPVNGAAGVTPGTLRWLPASGGAAHNLYLGTDSDAVRAAGPGSPLLIGTFNGPAAAAPALLPATTYFWRVDEVTPEGSTPGALWRFTTAPAAAPIPLAHWRLDDTTGTRVRDSAGTHDGLAAGGTTWTMTARYEGGIQLSGTSATLTLPKLNLTGNEVTLTAWLKLNAPAKRRAGILTWNPGSGNPIGLNFCGACELGYLWPGANLSDSFFSGLRLPDKTWCFAALAIRSTGATIYLHDGDTISSATHGGVHDARALDIMGWIGRNPLTPPGIGFDGEVDDVRVYGRALTQTEILAAMNSHTAPPGAAGSPQPADRALAPGAPVNPAFALGWSPGADARRHDVYFGATFPPPFLATTRNAATLPPLSTYGVYYWRIDELNSGGTTPGATWSFSTRTNAIGEAWRQYSDR